MERFPAWKEELQRRIEVLMARRSRLLAARAQRIRAERRAQEVSQCASS